ncbi:hypothetical protein Scep_002182 [Stephania cephalantha]|uniref:Uncharacterized protein n=1 Tax=Stephania cephalantha TaxID=152367 RepID=A0AAP0Q8I5_9MAGN
MLVYYNINKGFNKSTLENYLDFRKVRSANMSFKIKKIESPTSFTGNGARNLMVGKILKNQYPQEMEQRLYDKKPYR